jgi:mannose-1-phosphate guanylyltransferase
MAGGSGTRLWPLSRQGRPKQVLKLIGNQTMFQIAVERLAPLVPPERILVLASDDLADELMRQAPSLPSGSFITEPEGRGTAPVIGLGALHVRRLDPQAVMVCLTADHYISNPARFREVLAAAAQVAQRGHLVTLGISPSFPATGYGYIERGESLGSFGGFEVYRAAKFKEKPSAEAAADFLAGGRHSWNSGMFIWRADRILGEFERLLPETHAQLMEIGEALDGPDAGNVLARVWPTVAKETIDFGIMERARDVAVIPAAGLGWSDVGSWASLLDVLRPDEAGNVVLNGNHLSIDTTGSLIHSNRLVATIGVTDLIIVDTDDALLVCSRDRAQEVRAVVEELQRRGLHPMAKRPG